MGGRKPKPGNQIGSTRVFIGEPKPPNDEPQCPSHLDKIGKQCFRDVCDQLRSMNLLTRADGQIIELYCVTYGRYRKALAKMEKNCEGRRS